MEEFLRLKYNQSMKINQHKPDDTTRAKIINYSCENLIPAAVAMIP